MSTEISGKKVAEMEKRNLSLTKYYLIYSLGVIANVQSIEEFLKLTLLSKTLFSVILV